MKKRAAFALFLVLVLCFTACESKTPLYQAYKPRTQHNSYTYQYVSETTLSNERLELFEEIVGLSNGEIISLDEEHITIYTNKIHDFLNNRFYIDYLSPTLYESFVCSITVSKDGWPAQDALISSVQKCEVLIQVKYAEVFQHSFIKKYNDIYLIPVEIILQTTARDIDFFTQYPFLNNGDVGIQVNMLFDSLSTKLIGWQEIFESSSIFYYYI